MKKIFLMLSLSTFTFFNVSAQEVEVEVETSGSSVKSKSGAEILPQAGDFGIGFSATPILNYFGQLFTAGNTFGNNVVNANHPNVHAIGNINPANAIWAKYFVDANTAYRVRLQFDWTRSTTVTPVAENVLTFDPLNPTFVNNETTVKSAQVLLGAGLEKRRGSTRVQGIYGAEGLLGFVNSVTNTEYGNPLNVNFNAASGRTIETDPGLTWFFGVRGFAGVEYFIAPKFSIGGEFGYTLGVTRQSTGTITTEVWDSPNQRVVEVEVEDTNTSAFRSIGAGLDNINANLNLFFYF